MSRRYTFSELADFDNCLSEDAYKEFLATQLRLHTRSLINDFESLGLDIDVVLDVIIKECE